MSEPTIQACVTIIEQATKTTRRLVAAMASADMISADYANLLDAHLGTVLSATEDLVEATHASQERGRDSPRA